MVPGTDRKWIDVKRDIYRSHPHCRAVVVVRQDRIAVELDLRAEDGWRSSNLEGAEAQVSIPSMGVCFLLGELYRHTPLERP